MLMTTTPALSGRRYTELNVVMAYSSETKGSTRLPTVNAFLSAMAHLEQQAIALGGNAVIGVHVAIGDQNAHQSFYILLAGTAVYVEEGGFV